MSSSEEIKNLTELLKATLEKLGQLEKEVKELKENKPESPAPNVAILHTLENLKEKENKQTRDILNSDLLEKTAEAIMECKKRGLYDQPH